MSLDNFKKFVKENPKLVNFVRNGDMTWQKFYELYDLYVPFHVQDFISNREKKESDTKKSSYEPRPIFKNFDD